MERYRLQSAKERRCIESALRLTNLRRLQAGPRAHFERDGFACVSRHLCTALNLQVRGFLFIADYASNSLLVSFRASSTKPQELFPRGREQPLYR